MNVLVVLYKFHDIQLRFFILSFMKVNYEIVGQITAVLWSGTNLPSKCIIVNFLVRFSAQNHILWEIFHKYNHIVQKVRMFKSVYQLSRQYIASCPSFKLLWPICPEGRIPSFPRTFFSTFQIGNAAILIWDLTAGKA